MLRRVQKSLVYRTKRLFGPAETAPVAKSDAEMKIERARAAITRADFPPNISINLGEAPCNHSCLFCPQSLHKPKKAQYMDFALLEKVLNELPDEGVNIHTSAYMETLSCKTLVDSIRMMKKIRPKLPVIMASNGSIFPEDRIEDLIDAGLDWYSYSFDAATREDYKELIQKDHFDRVWNNLERIVEMRNERRSNMKITTHIMKFEGKEDAFKEFADYWGPKLDGINFRRVWNWGGGGFDLSTQMAEHGFVRDYGPPEERFPCASLFTHLKLTFDGTYSSCVAAEHSSLPGKSGRVGNARDITVQEAWKALSDMRQAHLHGRWDEYGACRNCDAWGILWEDMWFKKEDGPDRTSFYLQGVEQAM
ncbi:MAG: radical SAM/SPASM domain-containing protein [Rhodospirillales bacterium]|nr:radical SAM/SPASM domain-containing protein [Rhodospirillales bacterium]